MKRTSFVIHVFMSLILLAACALVVAAQESKSSPKQAADETAIRENVRQMEAGWNTKSGAAFAKPFAEDADYVIINGMHIKGRPAIEQGHQQIFDTIYKNTTLSMTVQQIRFLRPDVALAHVAAHLKTPDMEASKEHDARITMVMTKDKQGWKIAAFQNTQVEQQQHSR
ncbi:MAG: SgcJ/EcaC family oxidoreductase [Pyrinomonadaceae bacterium]|nr:SgcJ/EcaC family oxidoreductase [Pyrinomonadaceae bacterium]